jgi:hypothetical protein
MTRLCALLSQRGTLQAAVPRTIGHLFRFSCGELRDPRLCCEAAGGRTSVDHRSGFRAATDAELGTERFDGVKGGELMPTKPDKAGARAGDWVEPRSVHGQASRRGEIIEVLGREGHEHYRVRWDEQHESIVYPADGVVVTPGPARRGSGAGKRRAQ